MKSLKELQLESNGQTRLLFHHNYWDGPINGMMLWNGEMKWFEMFDESYKEYLMPKDRWDELVSYYQTNYGKDPDPDLRLCDERTRKYKVYTLPDDVKKAIIHNHELFKKYVGTHTDYDENGHRHIGKGYLKPYSSHIKYYNNNDDSNNNNFFVRWFPFLFKKKQRKDIKLKYVLDLESYEVVGEFKE